jgi:hypothetical protein
VDRWPVGHEGNIFREDLVGNPSDGENHTLTEDRYFAAEDICEKEGQLCAVRRLDNPMSSGAKTSDCSLQRVSLAQP